MEVQASNGQTVGLVTGVLIDRPLQGADADLDRIPQTTPEDGVIPGENETPDANATPTDDTLLDPTLTPEVDTDVGEEGGAGSIEGVGALGLAHPKVVYVLVEVTGDEMIGEDSAQPDAGDDQTATDDPADLTTPTPLVLDDTGAGRLTPGIGTEVLIPWEAFDFAGLAFDMAGQEDRSQFFGGDETETPSPGTDDLTLTPTPGLGDLDTTATPEMEDGQVGEGVEMDTQDRILVLNVDADVAAAAPTLNELNTDNLRMPDWNAQVSQYWSEPGVGPIEGEAIPETGTESDLDREQNSEIVMIRDEVMALDLTGEMGENLG